MGPAGQAFWTLPAWSWDPKMMAGDLLARPTEPNPIVIILALTWLLPWQARANASTRAVCLGGAEPNLKLHGEIPLMCNAKVLKQQKY